MALHPCLDLLNFIFNQLNRWLRLTGPLDLLELALANDTLHGFSEAWHVHRLLYDSFVVELDSERLKKDLLGYLIIVGHLAQLVVNALLGAFLE